MASRYDVSFYKDLLHKPVVDCDGQPVGAVLDLSAGPIHPTQTRPCVKNMVVRPRRSSRQSSTQRAGKPLVIPWELVASLEPRFIRLRESTRGLDAAGLEANEVLLRAQIMDQQIVDCRGLKLQRVNDIAMALSDGTLCLWGIDTGVRALLVRAGLRWGLFACLRPLFGWLHHHVISWECVDRLEPARGWIRLRIPRDEVRSVGTTASPTPTA
jgi:sporulation protein YlmC with PRC-barrel domain